MHIPPNIIPIFEDGIYLPMLLIIINHDIDCIEQGDFKLKEPYLELLNELRIQIEKDLEKTKERFKSNQMKITQGKKDQLFSEYYFSYKNFVELRRYSNIRLRNRSEELLKQYLHLQEVK